VQTWDEYYTQTLTLGIVSGPVEGILTLCIVYAITAVKGGGSYWQQSMLRTFGVPKQEWMPDYFYNLAFNEWYMVYGGIVLVLNTVQRYRLSLRMATSCIDSSFSAYHVMSTRKAAAAHTHTKTSPLMGLAPAFVMWAFVVAYLYLQPVILHYHLVPFVFFVGIINAYHVGLMIVAHLTKSPQFPYTNVLIAPVGLAVIDSLGPYLGLWPSILGDSTYQIAFMFACLGLGIGVHGSFIVSELNLQI
jgi:ethanolaminephosphotransferase